MIYPWYSFGMKPHEFLQTRLARAHTQREFGEVLGVTANTVARWERGERTIPPWVDRLLALWSEVADLRNALEKARADLEKARRQCQRLKAKVDGPKQEKKR